MGYIWYGTGMLKISLKYSSDQTTKPIWSG